MNATSAPESPDLFCCDADTPQKTTTCPTACGCRETPIGPPGRARLVATWSAETRPTATWSVDTRPTLTLQRQL